MLKIFLFLITTPTLTKTDDCVHFIDNSSDEDPIEKILQDETEIANLLTISDYHIKTIIQERYERTQISAIVENRSNYSRKYNFFNYIPRDAFMVKFALTYDGTSYNATVENSNQEQITYNQILATGLAKNYFKVISNNKNVSAVAITIKPEANVELFLEYKKLLFHQNYYEIVLPINPGRLVENLYVEISIKGVLQLAYLKDMPLCYYNGTCLKNRESDVKVKISNGDGNVVYTPKESRQREIAELFEDDPEKGMKVEFSVRFDLVRKADGGQFFFNGCFFIHFFMPVNFKQSSKYVLLLLDAREKMSGGKSSKMKMVVKNIANNLQDTDKITLITFDKQVKIWALNDKDNNILLNTNDIRGIEIPNPSKVNKSNIISILDKITEKENFDLYTALSVCLKIVHEKLKTGINNAIIILMSDGQNKGNTPEKEILKKISTENKNKVPIFTFNFNKNNSSNLMQNLADSNYGEMMNAYDLNTLDLSTLSSNFPSKTIHKLKFMYEKGTKAYERKYYPVLPPGMETVIPGKTGGCKKVISVDPKISMITKDGQKIMGAEIIRNDVPTEEIWAYLTLLQLHKGTRLLSNKMSLIEKYQNKLGLKYTFVTPLTSLSIESPGLGDGKSKVYINSFRDNLDPVTELEKHFPWLKGAIKNNKIRIKVKFQRSSKRFSPTFQCNNPISNRAKGYCVSMNKCKYLKINEESTANESIEKILKQHFCALGRTAGICC